MVEKGSKRVWECVCVHWGSFIVIVIIIRIVKWSHTRQSHISIWLSWKDLFYMSSSCQRAQRVYTQSDWFRKWCLRYVQIADILLLVKEDLTPVPDFDTPRKAHKQTNKKSKQSNKRWAYVFGCVCMWACVPESWRAYYAISLRYVLHILPMQPDIKLREVTER